MFAILNSKVSVDDLLKGAIIQSGNDSCIALAEGMAGNERIFAADFLTKRARELGPDEVDVRQLQRAAGPRQQDDGAGAGETRPPPDPRPIPTCTNCSARRSSPGTRSGSRTAIRC